MSPPYQYPITVSDSAIDGNGHVNNVVFVQWMQDAAVAHSGAAGCTQATQECGAVWVVRSHKIEYLRPVFPGDKILVRTWVANFRRVLSLRQYEFFRPADGATLATGETDWVFVDATSGRPRSIPESIQNLFVISPPQP